MIQIHLTLVPTETAGSTNRQEGLHHLSLATSSALCKAGCEGSCGLKKQKTRPPQASRGEKSKATFASGHHYTLRKHSSSPTSKGRTRKRAPDISSHGSSLAGTCFVTALHTRPVHIISVSHHKQEGKDALSRLLSLHNPKP